MNTCTSDHHLHTFINLPNSYRQIKPELHSVIHLKSVLSWRACRDCHLLCYKVAVTAVRLSDYLFLTCQVVHQITESIRPPQIHGESAILHFSLSGGVSGLTYLHVMPFSTLNRYKMASSAITQGDLICVCLYTDCVQYPLISSRLYTSSAIFITSCSKLIPNTNYSMYSMCKTTYIYIYIYISTTSASCTG